MNTETYSFIARREGKNFNKDNHNAVSVVMAAGLTLQEALEEAFAARVIGKGSHRSGVFQVQCDRGVWVSTKDARIDLSTPRKAKVVYFASWEEMEADEVAGGTGYAEDCGSPVETTGRTWF